jgi:hypothetical protein
LEEIATTVCETLHTAPLSRSSIWRILHEVDLKPHKSADWLNRHDEDFAAKAHTIGHLYVHALEAYEQLPKNLSRKGFVLLRGSTHSVT